MPSSVPGKAPLCSYLGSITQQLPKDWNEWNSYTKCSSRFWLMLVPRWGLFDINPTGLWSLSCEEWAPGQLQERAYTLQCIISVACLSPILMGHSEVPSKTISK